jgi:hypothetical protein
LPPLFFIVFFNDLFSSSCPFLLPSPLLSSCIPLLLSHLLYHSPSFQTFNVSSGTTVAELKEMYSDEEGVPVPQQRLIYVGKQLEDQKKLSEYNALLLELLSISF